jgi:uncharacterized membrane protein YphA (DoxX/SURF4 family)
MYDIYEVLHGTMKNWTLNSWLIEIISALLIFLFVYAALSKLLDFQKFRLQLGQSPMLTVFAGWVVWLIPAMEIIISIALAFPRFRIWGLYSSFSLMVMFTAYIVIITNYSYYVPCSCGGVLQNLTWKQHLTFNIGFLILSLSGVLFYPQRKIDTAKHEEMFFL